MSLMTIISVSSCLPSSNLAPADLSFCRGSFCFCCLASCSLLQNLYKHSATLGIPILSQLVHVHLLVEEKVQASLQPGIIWSEKEGTCGFVNTLDPQLATKRGGTSSLLFLTTSTAM